MASSLALPVGRTIKRVARRRADSLLLIQQTKPLPCSIYEDILKTRINSCSGFAVEQDQSLRYQCSNCWHWQRIIKNQGSECDEDGKEMSMSMLEGSPQNRNPKASHGLEQSHGATFCCKPKAYRLGPKASMHSIKEPGTSGQ